MAETLESWQAELDHRGRHFMFCIKSPEGLCSPGHQSLRACTKHLFSHIDLLIFNFQNFAKHTHRKGHRPNRRVAQHKANSCGSDTQLPTVLVMPAHPVTALLLYPSEGQQLAGLKVAAYFFTRKNISNSYQSIFEFHFES